jgi:flagellar biosynthesis protein FliR
MIVVILALRGLAAILVLSTLVGGVPRVARTALAVTIGLWSGLLLAGAHRLEPSLPAAIHELAIGAALGVIGAIPLLAASAAGRLVDIAASGHAQGPFGMFFGVLAAAVFVGVDGHVAMMTAIVDSHGSMPALATARPSVLDAIATLIPAAIRLAVPWLVTAAVVQIAVGVGVRLAERAGTHAPAAAAVPAALVMMTASLVATLALAMVAVIRAAI